MNTYDNIIEKIDRLLIDDDSGATVDSNVATNTAKGSVAIVGGKCPDGMIYDKKKKTGDKGDSRR